MSTKIEWTDETWNPTRGCSRVSEGCRNCYAERVAARLFSQPGQPYEGLARFTASGPRWTGKLVLDEEALEKPLHWKKPRRVFVNSMSDLFHGGLDASQIADVFAVMSNCPQHTFQVLTKRPTRMLEIIGTHSILRGDKWPLPNVWLGVSVEDQATADERIPLLLQTPAAVRFVSCEPLIRPVTLQHPGDCQTNAGPHYLTGYGVFDNSQRKGMRRHEPLDWVIVGAESGPGARMMDWEWARDIVIQCADNGTPCFVKQLCDNGRKIPFDQWPEDLQVRQWPEEQP